MAGGDRQIHKHPKANTGGFDKNPENINLKGRPKKGYAQLSEKIKQLGYEVPSKSEVIEINSLLMVMKQSDLVNITNDEDTPIWIKHTITDLDDNKKRQALMADLRDWIFGKASQATEISGTITATTNPFQGLTIEQLDAIENIIDEQGEN